MFDFAQIKRMIDGESEPSDLLGDEVEISLTPPEIALLLDALSELENSRGRYGAGYLRRSSLDDLKRRLEAALERSVS